MPLKKNSKENTEMTILTYQDMMHLIL